MRIGILALLHESNTFSMQPTTLKSFQNDLLLEGEPIRAALADSKHEIGGFFAGLSAASTLRGDRIEAVPIFAARALPAGTVAAAALDQLCRQMWAALSQAGRLDGILVAPHGAMVSDDFPDADGLWLANLRQRVGPDMPIVGTLDAHANLSRLMVESCDALVAYRSNPHLDQRDRGIEAARLMVQTVAGEIRPVMRAAFPPLAINIERQHTAEPHLKPLYKFADDQLQAPGVLSNSVLLGFPYADVAEMGSAAIVVTDNNESLAQSKAAELGTWMWNHRRDFLGEIISVDESLERCRTLDGPVCLLDMGDNVGGGSSADGTVLAGALASRQIADAFVCIFDPQAVKTAEQVGVGQQVELRMGGKTDLLHGEPLELHVHVLSLHDGVFRETEVRHGGIRDFDQGRTAIVRSASGLTVMLTSRRMVPFSLEQLRSCGLDPAQFRILVAKGVNAPVAAYQEVCRHFIRVNTPGSTCADMTKLAFQRRRKPLFPFETETAWNSLGGD